MRSLLWRLWWSIANRGMWTEDIGSGWSAPGIFADPADKRPRGPKRMAEKRRIAGFIAPVVVAIGLVVVAWFWLGVYTRHNARAVVPDLTGSTIEEAQAALAAVDLQAEVIDSVYHDEAPKGTVVDQDPNAGKEVKPGRTIYLVMNASEPKMLDMPQLVNLSKRQAISVLDIIGLKVKEMQYRPDPCTDCVVAQLYKGKAIAPETRIRRGESITLVLGGGMEGERVPVPDVRGANLAEVKALLHMASLNLGVVVECIDCNTASDSALARVARQTPEPYSNNTIGAGGMIDVWLTLDTTGMKPAPRLPNDTPNAAEDEL